MRVSSSIIVLIVMLMPSVVRAQTTDVVTPGVWGAWGSGGWGHASTAEEGAARGMADLTRSAGMANLMNSQAAINLQDANRKYMENRVYGTDAFFDMRRINREARAAESGPRPTQDDLVRFARQRAPSQLSVNDLDPYSGQVSWPPILREEPYAEQRQVVESLFAERAMVGQLSSPQRIQIQQASQAMQDTLRSRINEYAPQDYAQTRAFLRSLSAELTRPST
ncbi:MAG: hypothetical protein KJ000_09695 [Pirellulaceae bacterium]|nr:hypothetical protein [Pirellulaceae bacterium]